MITLINGTNRAHNITQVVTRYFKEVLAQSGVEYQYVSLEQLPRDVFTPEAYNIKPSSLLEFEETYLYPADKFLIVFPEYNGSFPGVLKTLIDYSDIKRAWWNKKVALAGVSDGRSGGLRGIDQMTTFFHYLKVNVYPHYLPISSIKTLLDGEKKNIISETTKKDIQKQVEGFVGF